MSEMTRTTMLKWCRREKGMTQQALGDAVGLNANTIYKLESNHEVWNGLKDTTKEKLNTFFEGTKYWVPLEMKFSMPEPTKTEEVIKVEPVTNDKPTEVHQIQYVANQVAPTDIKALTLIEFAYEGLQESKTHEDFVANINMLKRIISKYY